MGALSSKHKSARNAYAGQVRGKDKLSHQKQKVKRDVSGKVMMTQPTVEETVDDQHHLEVKGTPGLSNVSDDEFYDGIPRYRRSLSLKSRSLKVAEVGSRLGRAGSVGLERAVEVLDTLGSSVSGLNLAGGFVTGGTNKNNELAILSFEVANTIVKGSNLMQSLSARSMRHLKDVILPTEGIQRLISDDVDKLLSIVAADKREELKVFAGEVIRFGNRCKDPQWHDLDRFFEKRSRDRISPEKLKEVAESVMLQLMNSVQLTAELYQGLHTLDELEQDHRKRLVDLRYNAGQRGDRDNSVNLLSARMKSQKRFVKTLKKKSLWSRSMEEVMEKLVDIVLFLNQEINNTFSNPEGNAPEKESIGCQPKLGPAGLALHYANIILQIDAIVARSSSMLATTRDTLYQSLPPSIKVSYRPKLQSFHVEKELTINQIKDEMEKTLHWLVPVAANTAKAHHGFGWVGEWATTGSEPNRRTAAPSDVMEIETLHYADRQKTEAYIVDLLVWLNYLVTRSKSSSKKRSFVRPLVSSPTFSPETHGDKKPHTEDVARASPTLNTGNELVQVPNCKSKTDRSNYAPDSSFQEENVNRMGRHNELSNAEMNSSGSTFVDLALDENSLDVIDRVN